MIDKKMLGTDSRLGGSQHLGHLRYNLAEGLDLIIVISRSIKILSPTLHILYNAG